MNEIKILYLYPDMLDLYGDIGNIKILKYRAEKRGINVIVDSYSINDKKPDFCSYDIIFAGGGADNEQQILAEDLAKNKTEIEEAINKGVFLLLICGSFQLFGQYYKDVDGNIIQGLKIFDYYTEAIEDRKKRCIGDIIIKVNIDNKETEVIGFENHGGQTFNIGTPFGSVIHGNGNKFGDTAEGFMQKNIIATYLHGPLLSKNPAIADFIIKYAVDRKYDENIILQPIDDEFEEKCREQLIKRITSEK